MKLTSQDLAREIAATGFSGEALDKVFRLIGLLNALNSHPFLKARIVLKGGTALNLFHFDVPRLSVDIDLNYIGAADRDTMLAERPKLEQAVQAVCSREGLTVRRMPPEHAGGKWRLTYAASAGGSGNLELDVNFMLRTPLWAPQIAECFAVGSFKAAPFPVLDPHELAAGKLAALLARSANRDVFDAHRLLGAPDLDRARLRFAFVVYGGINRKDWRTVSADDVKGNVADASYDLVPMLRSDLAPPRGEVTAWFDKLVAECRERLAVVLPLTANELEFLERLNGSGDIVPELLTDDAATHAVLRDHPGLKWKALNVKKRLGVAAGDEEPTG
jgi:predicted nucleotidyltransferase component of viral defense system